MATRIKTVEYWFPELAAATDNTDTTYTQITVYLPESSIVFRSVHLDMMIQDAEATSNNVTRRQISLRLAAVAYSDVNNTNLFTSSGEQKWIPISGDFTSYFTTNWTGTSMTCDAKVLCDSAIVTPVQGWRCGTAKLTITYEYDDTSSSQVKTVLFPLITPIAAMATAKPGTATDTIPALDTWLPETTKTIRQIALVVQGNEEYSGTTDHSMSWIIDSAATYTTGIHEAALNTSCFYRHCQIQSFTTNATHSFYIYASVATFAHCQAFLSITYEYDEANSTSIMNSLRLPMQFKGEAGSTTNADYQRESILLWIEEPTTIAVQRSSLWFFWERAFNETGVQYRVGAGSWSGAIDTTGVVVAGSVSSAHRCDNDLSLARGANVLQADIYCTDASYKLSGITGLWILNYTSGKASGGSGSHNHTIIKNIDVTGTGAVAPEKIISSVVAYIPETDYFINSYGCEFIFSINTTNSVSGICVQMERLSGEGGIKWENLKDAVAVTDNLAGIRITYGQNSKDVKRFTGDYDSSRIDCETSRRYKAFATPANTWKLLNLLYTYHSITYTVSGTISGSAAGTVNVKLISNYDKEVKIEASRSGNGAYSIIWYDDTQQVWVDAYEDATHLFRSALGYPS
jgi:hypothetical protein